jgi:hypothetical protein
MAAFSYSIIIECLGNKDDIRDMWIAMSVPGLHGKPKSWGRRKFNIAKLVPYTDSKELDWFFTEADIDIDENRNFLSVEEIRGDAGKLYDVIAKVFPRIDFFFFHLCEPNNGAESQTAYHVYEDGDEKDRGLFDLDGDDKDAADRSFRKIEKICASWRKANKNDAAKKDEAALRHEPEIRSEWKDHIASLDIEKDRDEITKTLALVPIALEYLKQQDDQLCATALKHDPFALRYIRNKIPAFTMMLETENGFFEKLPPELRTPEICAAACGQIGLSLKFVPEKLKTPTVCSLAVEQNPLALEFVPEKLKNKELCARACEKNVNALHFTPKEFTVCFNSMSWLATVEKDFHVLKTLSPEQQTFEVCLAALKQNPFAAFRMIKNQTPEICLAAVKMDGLNILPLVKQQTPEICRAAVEQNPKARMFARIG